MLTVKQQDQNAAMNLVSGQRDVSVTATKEKEDDMDVDLRRAKDVVELYTRMRSTSQGGNDIDNELKGDRDDVDKAIASL
jgi:hypothetical protein